MSDNRTILYRGHINKSVFLSRDFMGKDQYRSRFSLPVESNSFSTERKVVRKGEGPKLKRFLKNPVHTSPNLNRPAHRTLLKKINNQVERYIVQSGRAHAGYTIELIGCGAPSITWQLKRLVSRRSVRYNPVKLLGAKGSRQQYRKAMARLENDKPLAFESESDKFMIDHWSRTIHFILLVTAFENEGNLNTWIQQHPRIQDERGYTEPINRQGAQPLVSDPVSPGKGYNWFTTTGWYALPYTLTMRMSPDAKRFVFSHPGSLQYVKAHISRGPDNPVFNFLNLPLEAASLLRKQAPPGSVLTKFTCDLRLEIFKYI
jgi:hypothetical protein